MGKAFCIGITHGYWLVYMILILMRYVDVNEISTYVEHNHGAVC